MKGAAPECLEPIDDADQQRFVRAFNDRDFDTLSGLVKSGFDVNRLVFNDNPAIVMAARYGDPQRIAALASFGAKVDLTGSENESALFLAVKQPSLEKTRKLATVSALLDAGANPNLRSAGGSSPVLWAVTVDDLELLTLLLDHRGSPNQRVECQIYCLDRNRSALSFARSPAVAELLIRRGASATYRDAEGRGLLDYAFNPDIVKALIAAGADVNEVDVGGWTPLMHVLQAYAQNPAPARRASYKAIATILVNSGARLDIKNQWGLDALYYSGDESFNRELRQLAAPH
ncbi:MAG: ankyrin repeat domain-containing protein [Steroidobacteraceae bacterium]